MLFSPLLAVSPLVAIVSVSPVSFFLLFFFVTVQVIRRGGEKNKENMTYFEGE